MYSDSEIDAAVSSGAIDRTAADRLRASIAAQRHSDPADDEQFRLVTGFNDVFVTIAAALVLFACGSLFGSVGGLAVAAASWGLAEHFTRRRHMALPSIFLLICYAGGVFGFLVHLVFGMVGDGWGGTSGFAGVAFFLGMSAAGCVTAAAVAAHWRRFHVPITIAAGALSVAVVAGSLFGLALAIAGVSGPVATSLLQWFAFAVGVALFAYAMRWDLQDPERITRRSDVAFWLHLAASPLIVHPLFLELGRIGSHGRSSEVVAALLAILLYVGLGLLALVVDRRAVLVSALVYVVTAIAVITRTDGQIGSSIAVSGAVIGGLLLAMSVFWRDLRRALVGVLPAGLRLRLPETRNVAP
jgi:hypothetical protein